MKIRILGVLAGLVLVPLFAAQAAEPPVHCECPPRHVGPPQKVVARPPVPPPAVHHVVVRPDVARHEVARHDVTHHNVVRHDVVRHEAARRAPTPHPVARREVVRREVVRHFRRPDIREHDMSEAYAQSYYDYRSSSTVSETVVEHHGTGAAYGAWQVAPNDAHIGFHYGQDYDQGVIVRGGDFTGGVGYGVDGFDGYGGGYGGMGYGPVGHGGRVMHGLPPGRRGISGARARMSVWHGYNGRNGIGNGY